MTIWEAILATVPATVTGLTALILANKATNKRIDDLQDLVLIIVSRLLSDEEIQKAKRKTGTTN